MSMSDDDGGNPPQDASHLTNFTSAIPGLSVAKVRRALFRMRKAWAVATPNNPIFLCDVLIQPDMTIGQFATRFVYGHHMKRHQKSLHLRAIMRKVRTDKGALCAPALEPAGVPGPKGTGPDDAFPFTPGWRWRALDPAAVETCRSDAGEKVFPSPRR
jgi:hypothetical protein